MKCLIIERLYQGNKRLNGKDYSGNYNLKSLYIRSQKLSKQIFCRQQELQLYANPNLRLQIFAPSQSPHVYANQHANALLYTLILLWNDNKNTKTWKKLVLQKSSCSITVLVPNLQLSILGNSSWLKIQSTRKNSEAVARVVTLK